MTPLSTRIVPRPDRAGRYADCAPAARAIEPRRIDPQLVSLLRPSSFEADQYRALRHAVELAGASDRCRVIGVTSPIAADGKTLTAINLAGALAQAPDARVLLVDLDLRRPSVAAYLHADLSGPCLADGLLDGRHTLAQLTCRLDRYNLSVVLGRPVERGVYERLISPRLGELLDAGRHSYDYVVIDTAPLVPVPDSRVLAQWVDGFLVVVRASRTPRKLLGTALSQLDPPKVLGLVFNGASTRQSRYGKYYYGYYNKRK